MLPAVLNAGEWAVVSTSTAFMRVSPDYTSGLDNQLLMGSVVKVLESDRYWRRVEALEPSYTGWVNELQLARVDDVEAYIAAPKWICTADYTHIYSSPSADEPLCDFLLGDLVRGTGVVVGATVKVLLPSGEYGWALRSDVEDFSVWARERLRYAAASWSDGSRMVRFAKRFLGVPYMWGGTSVKHFDCSGLVRTVYFNFGILLPRDASQMVSTGMELPLEMSRWLPGDLLFFGRKAESGRPVKVTHVALYMGGGKIIHSSQLVRINSLVAGEPDCYGREPVAARRVLGHVDSGEGISSLSGHPAYFKRKN